MCVCCADVKAGVAGSVQGLPDALKPKRCTPGVPVCMPDTAGMASMLPEHRVEGWV